MMVYAEPKQEQGHHASRKQGQIVSRTGQESYLSLDDIGYGEVDGFQGANCRHGWFCYFEGISKPAYTEQDLEELEGEL